MWSSHQASTRAGLTGLLPPINAGNWSSAHEVPWNTPDVLGLASDFITEPDMLHPAQWDWPPSVTDVSPLADLVYQNPSVHYDHFEPCWDPFSNDTESTCEVGVSPTDYSLPVSQRETTSSYSKESTKRKASSEDSGEQDTFAPEAKRSRQITTVIPDGGTLYDIVEGFQTCPMTTESGSAATPQDTSQTVPPLQILLYHAPPVSSPSENRRNVRVKRVKSGRCSQRRQYGTSQPDQTAWSGHQEFKYINGQLLFEPDGERHSLYCSNSDPTSATPCEILKVKRLTEYQRAKITYFGCSPTCLSELQAKHPSRIISGHCSHIGSRARDPHLVLNGRALEGYSSTCYDHAWERLKQSGVVSEAKGRV